MKTLIKYGLINIVSISKQYLTLKEKVETKPSKNTKKQVNYNKRIKEKTTKNYPENKIIIATDHRKYKRSDQKYPTNTKTGAKNNGNKKLYLLGGLIGLLTLGLFRSNRKKILKLTRWANSNKWKSRALIASAQTGLAYSGVMAGMELYDLNYMTSDNLEYVYTGLMIAGAALSYDWGKKKKYTLLNNFSRKKVGFLAIAISFFMLSFGVGNRLKSNSKQITPMGYAVAQSFNIEKTEVAEYAFNLENTELNLSYQAMLNDNNRNFAQPDTTYHVYVNKEQPSSSGGKSAGAIIGYALLGIILTLLILGLSCAAACASSNGAVGSSIIILGIICIVFMWIGIAKGIRNA